MLKFAALEKKVKEKEEEKRESMERRMSNRATETSAPPSQVRNFLVISAHGIIFTGCQFWSDTYIQVVYFVVH